MSTTVESPRLKTLKSAPLNSWIALSDDETRIIAVGDTYDEAVKKSDALGIDDPLIFKTPKEWLSFSV